MVRSHHGKLPRITLYYCAVHSQKLLSSRLVNNLLSPAWGMLPFGWELQYIPGGSVGRPAFERRKPHPLVAAGDRRLPREGNPAAALAE
jgi:hypothetical protein